jgi:YD repeat-containing protein
MSIRKLLHQIGSRATTVCVTGLCLLLASTYALADVQWFTYAPNTPGNGGFIECDGPTPSSLFPCMLSATNAFYNVFWAAGLANGSVIAFDGAITRFTYTYQGTGATASIDSVSAPDSLDYPFNFTFYTRDIAPSYYIKTDRTRQANCISCTTNSVADPISPLWGAAFDTITDIPSSAPSIGFKRFYNSTDVSNTDFNTGWRHSFSRSIRAGQAALNDQGYVAGDPYYSGLYSTSAAACAAGFVDIKGRISAWRTATASNSGDGCKISVGGNVIDTLPIQQYSQPASSVTVFDVTRDDGQLVRFTLQNGVIVAPPSINLKLQQTSSGYTLTDANDSVETYDTNGKLLSIASRTGVVQAMSYDTTGRLSDVTDSFGHHLSLSYDSQNRLIGVTRQ